MLTAKQILVSRVQEMTGVLVSEQDILFGVPDRQYDGGNRNTKIMAFMQPWIPLANGYEIYYDRIHVSVMPPFVLKKSNCKTVYDIIEVLNNSLEFNFTIDDLVERTLPVPDGDDNIIFKPMFKPGSLGFYGPSYPVKTISEYINPDDDFTDPIVDQEHPEPTVSLYPPYGTVLRSYCKDGDLIKIVTGYTGAFNEIVDVVGSAACNSLTLETLTTTTPGVPGKFAICSYRFNKRTPTELHFKTKKFNSFGNYLTSDIVQFKIEGQDRWYSAETNGDITIPIDTIRFSIRVKLKDTDFANQFLFMVEKKGMLSITNTEPLVTQILLTDTPDTQPPNPPESGTLKETKCIGLNQWKVYEDGLGGTYQLLDEENSLACGYIQKPTLEVDLVAVTTSQTVPLELTYTLTEALGEDLELSLGLTHLTTVYGDIDTIEFLPISESVYAPITVGTLFSLPTGDLSFTIRIVFLPTTVVDIDKYVIVKIAEFGVGGKLANTTGISTNTTVTL